MHDYDEDNDGVVPYESPVEVRKLAVLRDGRRAPRGTASRSLYYPCCFRDNSEIGPRAVSVVPPRRRGAGPGR